MKKILSVGRYVSVVINYGLKARKGMDTFKAFMTALQSFEAERVKIWGGSSAPVKN
ncbi:hypothetical protein [Tenacibaculum finnmarkense]|uniref:hypothetical protein n=1 Tax=Tenacibaculum finnmarkense TaxID=2781243 RepID=UPI001E39A5E8|nr:hypothetical protein [Tenacibaculum finnmarkense]MCD8411770.1 hypothetical protein [Tenacibaculum finnmarkense genomovar ulcerans]MCD8454572.1 hypothetical protein [Tenacibaculum finnmarkense genomovar ulcerans]MCG8249222.1 hypothetical protein [Tenacibaculum finnmarkense genomovar finnmarkense]MCG8734172.1 hypothetical protein [Tenacibaculum finnmarkense]MCG8740990.1 hypothetical protein [Tenacibaculum finnmarkense]